MNNPKIKVVEVTSVEELQKVLKENGMPDGIVMGIGDAIRSHAGDDANDAGFDAIKPSLDAALGRSDKTSAPLESPNWPAGCPEKQAKEKQTEGDDNLHNLYVAMKSLFAVRNLPVPTFERFLNGAVESSVITALECVERQDLDSARDYMRLAADARKRIADIAKNKADLKHD